MVSCKDCVHVEVCEDFTKAKLSPKRAEELFPVLREHGRTCEHFKDRSRFIELPCNKINATVESNIYDEEETYYDCTVQVLRNSITGETSVGWFRNDEPPVLIGDD